MAGLAATVPMTRFMQSTRQQLPADERYPLPPREIAEELAEQLLAEAEQAEPSTAALHSGSLA